jgi:hypothetical protein
MATETPYRPERAKHKPGVAFVAPFQGYCLEFKRTQGVALGYNVLALRAGKNTSRISRKNNNSTFVFATPRATYRA